MSKKSCLFLYIDSLYENGQDFFDIQYYYCLCGISNKLCSTSSKKRDEKQKTVLSDWHCISMLHRYTGTVTVPYTGILAL